MKSPSTLRPTRLAHTLWLLAATALASACNSNPPAQVNPGVIISQPSNNQIITPAQDEDPNTAGVQFDVKGTVTSLNTGSQASLLIDGTQVSTNGTQTISTVTGAGTFDFSMVTLPSGTHTVSVEVTDKVSSVKAADTVTYTLQTSSGCTFVTPAPNVAITTLTTPVQVSCPDVPNGTPITLTIVAPSPLGGYTSSPINGTYSTTASSQFASVTLQPGKQTLLFSANVSGMSPETTQELVTVTDATNCAVWLGEASGLVYNAAGAPLPTPIAGDNGTPVADTDPSTPGEQGNFKAYVDYGTCPAGSVATLTFTGGNTTIIPPATGMVSATGTVTFANITIPDGDPVTETVTVVSATSSSVTGTSLPNLLHVDSVVPTLSILAPTAGLQFPSAGGIDVEFHETGVDANTQVTILDNHTNIDQHPAAADANGNSTNTENLIDNSQNTLEIKAVRKLGNVGTSAPVTVIVGTPAITIAVVSPSFTTCNHSNDANPATANCDFEFEVSTSSNATNIYIVGPGISGTTVGDGGINFTPTALDGGVFGAEVSFSMAQGGPQQIVATAVDAAGQSATAFLFMTVGTIPPVCTFISPDAGSTLTSQAQTVVVGVTGGNVSGDVSVFSNEEPGLALNNQPVVGGISTLPVQLPLGSQTITASTTDIYGNTCSISEPLTINTGTGCDLDLTSPSSDNPIFGLNNTVSVDAGAGIRLAPLTGSTTLCKGEVITVTKILPSTGVSQTLGTVTADPTTGDFTFDAPVSDGDVNLELQLTIGSGSSQTILTLLYYADFTPPVLLSATPPFGNVTIVAPTDPRAGTTVGGVDFVADTQFGGDGGEFGFVVNYSGAGSFADAGSGNITVSDPSGELFAEQSETNNGTLSLGGSISVPLSASGDLVAAVATDEAGNQATGVWDVTIDLSGGTTSAMSSSSTSSSTSNSSSTSSGTSSTNNSSSSSSGAPSNSSSSSSGSNSSSTTSSGSSSSGNPVPSTITIDNPSGVINLFQAQGGDRSTFATVQTTVVFSSAVPGNSTVQMCTTVPFGASPTACAVAGDGFVVPATPVSVSGTFETFGALEYAEGPQTITAELLVNGAWVLSSAPVSITVATVPPVVSSVNVPQDPDGGPLNTLNWPSGSSINVDATITGAIPTDGGLTTASLVENGVTIATAPVVNGQVQFTLVSGVLGNGANTLDVLVTDQYGNPNVSSALSPVLTNSTDSITLNVGLTPPTIIVTAPAQGFTINEANNLNGSTSGAQGEVTFTVAVGSDVTSVLFGAAGSTSAQSVTPSDGTASLTYFLNQGSGQNLTATAFDAFGNSTSVSVTVNVDTVAPIITSVVAPTTNETYTSQTVNFDVRTSGAQTGDLVIVTSSETDGGEIEIAAGPTDSSGEAIFSTSSAPEGSQSLTFTITDANGNTSAPVTVPIDVQVTGCAISLTFPSSSTATFNASQQSGGNVTITGRTTTAACFGLPITFTKTPFGGSSSTLGSVNTNASNGSFSFQVPFTNGETNSTISASMTDSDGTNTVSFVASAQFTLPTLGLNAPTANGSNQVFVVAAGNTFLEAGTAGYVASLGSGSGGVLAVTFTTTEIGGGTVSIYAGSTLLGTQTVSGSSSQQFTVDVTLAQAYSGPLTVTATDTAGNVLSTSLTISEVDGYIPTAPSSVNVTLVNQYHSDFNVTFTVPSTPDHAALTGEVGCSSALILGTTTVNDTVYDNGALFTYVDFSTLTAAGTQETATFTKMPPFNTNECYVRATRPSGNRSALPSSADTLAVFWTKSTLSDATGTSTPGDFGGALSIGDINGDGRADIAIGASGDNSGVGTVEVVYGGSLPLTRTQLFSGNSTVAGEEYGVSVALGDINGDGHSDLVICATDKVDIFLAPPDGGDLPTTSTTSLTGFAFPAVARILPGVSSDGGSGLFVGDAFAPSTGGTVYVFLQKPSWTGITAPANADVAIQNQDSSGQLSWNSAIVASPKFDGTATSEIFVGDALHNGVAFVFDSSELLSVGSGPISGFSPQVLAAPSPAPNHFGWSSTFIDMNYDGLVDLLVGTNDVNGAEVFDFTQGSGEVFEQPTGPYVSSSLDGYGTLLTSGDLSQDSHADLMIGTGSSDTTGTLDFYFSGPSAVSSMANGEITGSTGYGSVVVVGDVNGDGNLDLIVGEPGNGNGNVYIYY